MNRTVEATREGEVCWLSFRSRLPMNIISLAMLGEFHEALDGLEADPPRVLMIQGEASVFSGGADLSVMRDMSDADYRAFIEAEYRLFRRIDGLPFITIAVMAGPCIGNAAELALACDLRIVASDLRFGLPETKVGFPAPAQRLARYVGVGRAKQLVYEGQVIRAEAALALGLVTQVVEPAELAAEAAKLATRYAAFAPLAIRLSKAAMGRVYGLEQDHDAAELAAAFAAFRSDDFREGATAALERRPPVFTGR